MKLQRARGISPGVSKPRRIARKCLLVPTVLFVILFWVFMALHQWVQALIVFITVCPLVLIWEPDAPGSFYYWDAEIEPMDVVFEVPPKPKTTRMSHLHAIEAIKEARQEE